MKIYQSSEIVDESKIKEGSVKHICEIFDAQKLSYKDKRLLEITLRDQERGSLFNVYDYKLEEEISKNFLRDLV